MKRLLAPLTALVLGGLAAWLYGRAPTDYVLEQQCGFYQEQRLDQSARLEPEIARLEQALVQGAQPDPALARLREQRERIYRAHRVVEIRGWEVLLLPDGADRPAPRDYLVAGRFDPSRPTDPPPLRRPMEVWIRPVGGLARLLWRLGLSP